MKNYLYIIPARAGSKGIPNKNMTLLNGKELITYSIDYARHFTDDKNICITTDDKNIIEFCRSINLSVPFVRPSEIATDTASADDVIKHAMLYYSKLEKQYDAIIYLQPTSPFRLFKHLEEAIKEYESVECDLVTTVCETSFNPYFSLFEENENGYLQRSKKLPNGITRRQDAPKAYQYNGSIYIINIKSLVQSSLHLLPKIKKVVVDDVYIVDIDKPIDLLYAQFLIEKKLIPYD